MRSYKPSPKEKEQAVLDYRNGMPQWQVCRKHHFHRDTIRRWNLRYDGTLESLTNQSSRPKHSPKAHRPHEIRAIKKVIAERPECLQEIWEILRTQYSYKRTYGGFYRFIRKHDLIPVKMHKCYIPQPYDTPTTIGVKWQMDIKNVPYVCLPATIRSQERWFQYTMIDEYSREVFRYGYRDHSSDTTLDFMRRALAFYGYKPNTIQTDNGIPFTNPKSAPSRHEHAVDQFCRQLKIKHKCIRPYTPRHNGKVERTHRNDQQMFYAHHTGRCGFADFENYQDLLQRWTQRSNNIPSQALSMQSPNHMRQSIRQTI